MLTHAIAAQDGAGVEAAMRRLLARTPAQTPLQGEYREVLRRGLRWYDADRARPANALLGAIEHAIRTWGSAPAPDIDVLCDFGDFLFHAVWSFEASSVEQCRIGRPAMTALAEALARGHPPRARPAPIPTGPLCHVMYVAMYADPRDPITVGLRHLAPAILANPDCFRLTVIAWCDHTPDFLAWLRDIGASVHALTANRPEELVLAIESLVAADPPDIAISDMNTPIPTALFARGLAPAQIFLQGGLPLWPLPRLDAVFNSFGFDPEIAGWGSARMLPFAPPWDLAKLNPPPIATEEARAAEDLAGDGVLLGTYGRLVKVTPPLLRAVERILLARPDARFVTGGSGDAGPISAFIAASPAGARMRVIEGYVPGQAWGRRIDIGLDTWPLTGGESARELIAKGKPVVMTRSAEMPALEAQRDPALVAGDWDEFVAITTALIDDPDKRAAAGARALALAERMADPAAFAHAVAQALAAVSPRAI
jgi:hypothetical protein